MQPELVLFASELAKRGEPFALATVVRREPPSSARVGDTALVTQGGGFHGWVGGSCTQPTVVREALRALAERAPRLIALSPSPEADHRPGVTAFPMTCHSGGSVDIYIQPVLPAPRLVVFGGSPVGQALARLGKALGYAVDAVDPAADRATFPEADRVFAEPDAAPLRMKPGSPGGGGEPWLCAVVATMGQWDEDAVRAAVALDPAYLGVVASRTRFAEIREAVMGGGIAGETLERIRNPAGLDIGAEQPEEIALSVLAEIVQVRRTAQPEVQRAESGGSSPADEALDPICGMTVAVATARHRAEYGGRTYYFCCAGCREQFLRDPPRYATARVAGAEGAA
ncbi:MAG: XdhC family protein [Gemmatimonadetes bacterium]|nr:XdhC family protein [Gemmatimonadota bacterium]